MELVGKSNLNFIVQIDCANNLPSNLCYNPYVKYRFQFERSNQWYSTPEMKVIEPNPKFNYKKQHKIDFISQDVAECLKNGNISFNVYGFPP